MTTELCTNIDSKTSHALETLLGCLQCWGKQHSNAVLDLLANDPLIINKKYPDRALACANNSFQLFYHFHNEPFRYEDEHGHFHVFLRNPDYLADNSSAGDHHAERWSHVAALSMDCNGQAIRWFTVNRWVSGGAWLDSNTLKQLLFKLEQGDTKQSLVQTWFTSMLIIFRDRLACLLDARDNTLRQLRKTNDADIATLLENRQHYILSDFKFDLGTELEKLTQS